MEKITAENVKRRGELIAIHALKITMSHSGRALDDLYRGLIHDVFDYKPIDQPYSDGWSLRARQSAFFADTSETA